MKTVNNDLAKTSAEFLSERKAKLNEIAKHVNTMLGRAFPANEAQYGGRAGFGFKQALKYQK